MKKREYVLTEQLAFTFDDVLVEEVAKDIVKNRIRPEGRIEIPQSLLDASHELAEQYLSDLERRSRNERRDE